MSGEVQIIGLDEVIAKRSGSVDPAKFPSEIFELLSIPAFDSGRPEIKVGAEIGSTKQIVEEGDVLLSKIVPHIRRAWVVKPTTKHRLIASGEWIVFRDSRFDPSYLRHLLIADGFHRQFMQTVSGIGGSLLRARPAEVAKIKVPLPPLKEQQRIAAILDKADSLCRKRQTALRLADQLLRAVFVDMYGDPTENPKGWPVFPMGEVIEFKGGSQPPKDTFISEPRAGYVRLVQIRDFKTDKYKTYIPESLAKRAFDETDVMVARYGPPVFQILRGLSGSYNVALMKAQPRENVLKEFVFWLLQLPKYQQAVISNSERTAGQTGVNLDFLNALLVPLTTVAYQEVLVKVIIKISSLISKQRKILIECNNQLSALHAKFFS
jgi:type I restriction enzyme S subunit